LYLAFAVCKELNCTAHGVCENSINDIWDKLLLAMKCKQAASVGELEATAQETGRRRYVVQMLGVDVGGGNVIFRFVGEGYSKGEGEIC
jgi:hypothetical protein